MKTLLQINSSLYADGGESSKLTRRFIDRWRAANPNGRVIVRDLATDPVPHLDAERFAAFRVPPEEQTPRQAAVVAYSDALIAELVAADDIVFGLPMYNFGIPSMLKAWIDHVARAGVTFRYTAEGSVGALTNKIAWVLATRGGRHVGTAGETQTPYVRFFLGFLGIEDVRFIYAEGLALGDDSRDAALAAAATEIDAVVAAVGSPESEKAARSTMIAA